ncbi:MAG: bacillithiol system redox-active protein YtxJ [Flavobacteriales bacterium CG_4_9_14_0_2_um_filter_35_242]|nr:bacillithiol system redox-active protein YtxJ [Zetaproteobacteria bacterium]NDK18691.1 bacillithiol system redox-active protein YtxJ [Flavobacteriales bacterium]OIO10764.1 MAG: hypothetical protein AUJ53_06290 [Flavobacteriaceae bacterium CG1_02_35_72]PIR12777.1 MAG: bacillithiol system redox-active protein YtxJ [Flavobacteriales bacterium CG11_big_fil_rev_8_21_14_0_20_35_7]PIV18307.1 MAG: bacillithiol system redox-active protein YtxJ [Flavobacteriales bacterium CG03_land_8_20_14_0_80_35_15]
MNFIKSLFKSDKPNHTDKPQSIFPWKDLNAINQIDQLEKDSFTKKIVIFKHSTQCGISRAVLKNFERQTEIKLDVTYYLLDLLSFREVSNTLASRFDVQHQSPQLLVLKNGKVIAHDSHYELLNIVI